MMNKILNYKSKKEIRDIIVLFSLITVYCLGSITSYSRVTNESILSFGYNGINTILFSFSLGIIIGILLTIKGDENEI